VDRQRMCSMPCGPAGIGPPLPSQSTPNFVVSTGCTKPIVLSYCDDNNTLGAAACASTGKRHPFLAAQVLPAVHQAGAPVAV
jgi:hypothetical protein